MIFLYDFRRDVPAPKNLDLLASVRPLGPCCFTAGRWFRSRSPAAAVREAAAVQQPVASQQLLTALNKMEIR